MSVGLSLIYALFYHCHHFSKACVVFDTCVFVSEPPARPRSEQLPGSPRETLTSDL